MICGASSASYGKSWERLEAQWARRRATTDHPGDTEKNTLNLEVESFRARLAVGLPDYQLTQSPGFSPYLAGGFYASATFIISLPKFSPRKSLSNVSGKVWKPSTMSSFDLSLPAFIQPAISRAASP